MNSTPSTQTRSEILASIGAALQNQSITALMNSLADAQLKITALEAEVEKLKKDLSGK